MPAIEDLLQQKINDLEVKINQKQNDVQDLSLELNKATHLLRAHTHSGTETNARLEPKTLKLITADATTYKVGGTAGLTGTLTVRNSAGTGTCTITIVSGIVTASTC